MKYMSITKRWFINVASIFFAILIAVSVAVFFLIRAYYYGAAEMQVKELSYGEVSSIFGLYGAKNSGFEEAARQYVDNYQNKDKLAVWTINSKGRVIVSSNGFTIREAVDMPDYEEAISNDEHSAMWVGKLPSGEKIMAYTCAYYYESGTLAGAIRYMVSMDAVDEQLSVLAALIIIVSLFCFTALFLSGMVFVRSIVNPVKDIGATAKKIAGGDLNASIDSYPYNDEIGELCNTINDMADKLSESDRLKNDFISTVSHELRTPLTAIKGWGETLQQIGDSDPGMTSRGMDIIISESTRLNEMVEELLDFSRMSGGRMKLNKEKTDYLAELDEVVFAFRDRTLREGIEVNYNVPADPAPGMADPSRLRQVFINILDNAVKYSEQGGKINVSAQIGTDYLEITVEDSGVGIAPEDLPHVKEKFYKANNTIRGSGIGLAVCDEIIRLHDGQLDIDSVYGQGTTVRIILPLDVNGNSKENTENE